MAEISNSAGGNPQGSGASRQPVSPQLAININRVKPWVAAALLLAVVVLGVYAFQTYRYWSSTDRSVVLTQRTDILTALLAREEPALAETAARLVAEQNRLEHLKGEFRYRANDGLITTLTTTAESNGIGLASITVADPAPEEIDGIRYQIQPIAVTALGSPEGITSFLESIGDLAPSATVCSIQLAGLDSTTVGKLRILFYLSPESIDDGEPEDPATGTP